MRRDVGASGLPFAVVKASAVGHGAFHKSYPSYRLSRSRREVLQERHDALDVLVEIKCMLGIEYMARFGVDLFIHS